MRWDAFTYLRHATWELYLKRLIFKYESVNNTDNHCFYLENTCNNSKNRKVAQHETPHKQPKYLQYDVYFKPHKTLFLSEKQMNHAYLAIFYPQFIIIGLTITTSHLKLYLLLFTNAHHGRKKIWIIQFQYLIVIKTTVIAKLLKS